MDWEDTVMSEEELINAYEIDNPADDHAIGCHSLALKQAEITFPLGEKQGIDKGRREAVEWIRNHGGCLDGLRTDWHKKMKEWLAKLRGQITPEQAAALSKVLCVIGLALITKPLLDMWPSVASTMVRGAIFTVAIILCLRVVRITPSSKKYTPWFIPLGAGAFLNFLVVLANRGFMPSACQDIPKGMYIPMAGSNLPYFGDWIFGFISPGDIILFVAFAGIIATMIANRRQKAVEGI